MNILSRIRFLTIVFKYFDKKYYFSHFIHMISTGPKKQKIQKKKLQENPDKIN